MTVTPSTLLHVNCPSTDRDSYYWRHLVTRTRDEGRQGERRLSGRADAGGERVRVMGREEASRSVRGQRSERCVGGCGLARRLGDANRCAALRCLPTAAITHLYDQLGLRRPARRAPRPALRRHMTNQYAADRLDTYLFDAIY
ncbi:unnamed protein product [Danaus chrysippus]|uniref:(African queen) hypothetical protein n=1 Tax=Danaus chrysippus TaxID=151541 RepID=A0A8J2R7X2_9NEOP|nr:unnamed protein product [Danaus chrysippus]